MFKEPPTCVTSQEILINLRLKSFGQVQFIQQNQKTSGLDSIIVAHTHDGFSLGWPLAEAEHQDDLRLTRAICYEKVKTSLRADQLSEVRWVVSQERLDLIAG